MAPTEWAASLLALRKLCSIFFHVLFLTLLGQNFWGVITYSQEELLDIRATRTHQHYHHYDQEYAPPGKFQKPTQNNAGIGEVFGVVF
jgi:hypothetical protein